MTEPAELSRRRLWPWILFVALVVTGALLLHSPWLSLHHIEINGAVRSDPAGRIAAAGIGEGAILIWLDVGAVERVVEADPWVADARAEREWPDTLRVDVAEREPIALIEGGDAWMLVATDGTVIEVLEEPVGAYLKAQMTFSSFAPGLHPSDPVWDEVVRMALVLRDDIGGTITLSYRGTELWTSALGYDIRLGSAVDLADKARTLRAMLSPPPSEGSIIDVSAPSRPAVIPPGMTP